MGCMARYEGEYNICPACGYVEDTPAADAVHIEPGIMLQDRYVVGNALGHGGFGVTYIGWDSVIERAVAIKEYLPSEFSTRTPGQTNITVYSGNKSEQFASGLDRFIDEAQRLAKFTSIEGIVNIYDTFTENNTAYIIMELLQGETLSALLDRVGKISINDALVMLMPIIKSLKTVHENGIIHRDIAPDNIFLLSDGSAKLIDFGAARFTSMLNDRSSTVIVKPGYSPEEQYQSKAIQGAYTDIYAIGATLYRMITGVVPPNALDRRASIENHQKDLLALPSKYCTIGDNTETAILNALNVQIEDRTQDISTFRYELTTNDTVKRKYGKIKTNKRWPLWAKIGVPAVLFIIAVFTLFFATGLMLSNRSEPDTESLPEGITRVPSVINDNLDMAESRLFEAELLYSIVGKEFSSEIAMNYVLKQDINGGTLVEVNTLLSLVVSGGVETRTMPSVKGAPLEEATSVLEYLEFDVHIEEQYSPVEEGMVILHDIQSDSELEVGGTVTLYVSEGADPSRILENETVILPDFVDMAYSDVLEEAEVLGATLAVNTEYSPTVERDQIISQSVPADSEIMTGDTVDITVSLGVETVTVRDVQFRTAEEAVTILEEQGLKINLIHESSDTVANNVVINQTPPANTVVEPGAEVSIIVSWDTDIASPAPTVSPSPEDLYHEEDAFDSDRPENLDLYEMYSEVLIPYRELIDNNFFPDMDPMEYFEWTVASKVNSFLVGSQDEIPIYYAFFDIDGNGIPELLIGSSLHRDHIAIFDVFTWHYGQVLYLFDYFLGERTHLFIHDNGVVAVVGSGGAFTHGWSFYEISPDGHTPNLLDMVLRDGQPPTFLRGSFDGEEISESEFESIIMQYTGRMPFESGGSSVSIEWHPFGARTPMVYVESLTPIASDRYTGNQGDSFIDRINTRNGPTGVNGITYLHGLEVWVARWNFRDEISWVWNEYDLSGRYSSLQGTLTVSNESFNQNNFDTTIEILGDGEVIFSSRVVGGFEPIDISINVENVNVLRISAHDNVANRGGTSFILGDLRLS